MCSLHSSSVLLAYLLQSVTLRIATAVYYETGNHVKGEVLAFVYQGRIPPGADQFKLEVAHQREDLQDEYTYFRVEVPMIYKKFVIGCNEKEQKICVYFSPAVYPRDIIVTGYAMPKDGSIYDVELNEDDSIDDLSDHNNPQIRPWISGGPLMFTDENGQIIIKL